MKLDDIEIVDLVGETEKQMADWNHAADIWESDWALQRYKDNRETKQDLDGVDVVVSPDPFNVIQVLHRMVADELRVEIPSLSVKEDDEERSEKIEEFLVAYETKNNAEQGTNLIHAKVWQSGVLGRGASQVMWMEPLLAKAKLSGKRLPISKRKLDPRNVGIGQGSMGVDFAYHKYEASRSYVADNYPDYTFKGIDIPKAKPGSTYWNEKLKVIDFWSRDKGSIIHHVVIDGKTAKQETTDYPDIPIVVWHADGAPSDNELDRSISILHPIHELWRMKCDIMSKVATGMMYHFDPLMVVKGSFTDAEWAALGTMGPGQKVNLRDGQELTPFSPAPNVPLAQALLAMIQTGIDQATFPGVTYGDAPGGVNAGFALNNLSQQARARANIIRSNIESAMEYENYLLLSMIEEFCGEEGMTIYGGSKQSDRGRPLTLKASDIKGNYDNRVMLIPEQPMADAAQINSYISLNKADIISKQWVRNRGLNVSVPRDEANRVAVEKALETDQELMKKAQMRAIQKELKQDDWEAFFVGTSFQQLWEQEQQWRAQKEAEREQARQQRREDKKQKAIQEMIASMPPPSFQATQGQPGMPPLPPTSGPMPPGMPPGGESLQPPGMQGLPPGAAGQMTPEMLGLGPENGAPPGAFQQAMGQPEPSELDQLRQMGIVPPPPSQQ